MPRLRVTFKLDELCQVGFAGGPDQLLLQVGDAGKKSNLFQLAAIEVWTVAGLLERRSDDFLFALVIETGKHRSRFLDGQPPEEPAYGVGAVDRNDRHAF